MNEREEPFHKENEDGSEEEHADEADDEHGSSCANLGKDTVDFSCSDAANKEEGLSEPSVGHVEGKNPGVADGVADAFDEVFESFHEAIHEAEEYHSAEEHDDGGEDEEEQHFNHRPGHEVDAVVEDHVGEAPEEK